MLDVRPTRYVVPLPEQEFASLTPTIRIDNYGTVGAEITGQVHIYRRSTGLRIYTSALTETWIGPGAFEEVAALTPWSPPAPIDDDYYIMCNVTAVATVPHEPPSAITQLGPFDFDIKPVGMGPAPAAHAVTHEDGGSDPLYIETLPTGETDDTMVLSPDGTGGVLFRAEAGGGAPAAHAVTHETGGSDEVHRITSLFPAVDSTSAVQILKANGTTPVLTIDTTNLRVGVGASTPAAKLDIASKVSIFDTTPPGADATTYEALRLEGGAVRAGICRESSSGEDILTFAINVPQIGTRDTAKVGGIFRLDTRSTEPHFIIFGYPTPATTPPYQARFIISLQTGEASICTNGGNLGIGTAMGSSTAKLDVNSDTIRLRTPKTPASASAAGNAGDICWDSNYLYVCVATNTWKRTALASW